MDLQALYLQAAEAAATVTVPSAADVEDPRLPSRAAVLLRFDVQQAVGLGADAAERHAGMMTADGDARAALEGGGLARELLCPECGKPFPSHKAMYGHLRSHPERGYKGSSRPPTPAASAANAGEARTKKATPRREAAHQFPPINWPVTAKRTRTPTVASSLVSAEPAADVVVLETTDPAEPAADVVVLETTDPAEPLLREPPPREVEPAPSLLEPPPRGVEPAPTLLKPPTLSEEVEAAMTLLDLYHQLRGEEVSPEPEDLLPTTEQMQVDDDPVAENQTPPPEQQVDDDPVAENQTPRPEQQVEPPAHHVAHHAPPVEHIFGIIVGSQAAEAEQSNAAAAAAAAAAKGKMPMEPEPLSCGALLAFRDRLLSPGMASKRPKKRTFQDLAKTQLPPADAGAAVEEPFQLPPALRRIPSPASDRKFMCPTAMCGKAFPTHQALGGHMASHNRANRCAAAAQTMDGFAAAHAVKNIMLHHQLRQGGLLGDDALPIPPVPRAPKSHSCSRCVLTFPTGQALGGHMRKHWIEEKGGRDAPPISLPAPPIADTLALAVAPPAALAIALAVPAEAVAAPGNALAVLESAPVTPATALALAVPVAAAAEPNGEPRDFAFDLNEMPME
ncbi:hypothetical protein QYE76_044689 [Lolium multiflorum]|uniref:C2H2-type domain-containing protein n=1 Tax=Lolium multiflorum TaxID=4521 RepID=A0AAD8TJT0_LOLMU|nr:hypothetical protein QYE76_044689 [Lolium multiflorum]